MSGVGGSQELSQNRHQTINFVKSSSSVPISQSPFNSVQKNNNNNGPQSSRYSQAFVKAGESYSSVRSGGVGGRGGYRMPGFSNLNRKGGSISSNNSSSTAVQFQKTPPAKPLGSTQDYLKAWKDEKDEMLKGLRKLAYEVIALKTDRPNAIDKLHSAANRVPIRIEFNTQSVVGSKNNSSFLSYVHISNIKIASGQGAKIRDSKTNAFEAALQKILMPYLRVIPTDPTSKELQSSREPFTAPPPEPSKVPLHNTRTDGTTDVSSRYKESNIEAANQKRRMNTYKNLDEFVIVEPRIPIPDCTPAHTLRRSADFNHMLLEYEYFFKGIAARCILRIENEVLADVNGASKIIAKNLASAQALSKLKNFCWIIKTKQAVDSNTKISKDEIVNELNDESDVIANDNIGNKLLRKMGWSGGGVGKDGDGIAEPVQMKSVLNREGLGLSASKGITDEYRKRVKEVIENYASSNNQGDLVFSSDFRLEERLIIHDECRRLNLRSKCKGKGNKRYTCVRRKRSVNQLFDHLMSVGGETARYQLVPPGRDIPQSMPNNSLSCPNTSRPPGVKGKIPSLLDTPIISSFGNNCAMSRSCHTTSPNPVSNGRIKMNDNNSGISQDFPDQNIYTSANQFGPLLSSHSHKVSNVPGHRQNAQNCNESASNSFQDRRPGQFGNGYDSPRNIRPFGPQENSRSARPYFGSNNDSRLFDGQPGSNFRFNPNERYCLPIDQQLLPTGGDFSRQHSHDSSAQMLNSEMRMNQRNEITPTFTSVPQNFNLYNSQRQGMDQHSWDSGRPDHSGQFQSQTMSLGVGYGRDAFNNNSSYNNFAQSQNDHFNNQNGYFRGGNR